MIITNETPGMFYYNCEALLSVLLNMRYLVERLPLLQYYQNVNQLHHFHLISGLYPETLKPIVDGCGMHESNNHFKILLLNNLKFNKIINIRLYVVVKELLESLNILDIRTYLYYN